MVTDPFTINPSAIRPRTMSPPSPDPTYIGWLFWTCMVVLGLGNLAFDFTTAAFLTIGTAIAGTIVVRVPLFGFNILMFIASYFAFATPDLFVPVAFFNATVLTIISLVVSSSSIVYVPRGQLLVLEYEVAFFLEQMGSGQIIALPGQNGPRAKSRTSGKYFIPGVWIFAKLHFAPHTNVGKTAIIYARDGLPLREGQIIADDKLRDFADGDEFLYSGGQKGWQLPVLGPGDYVINPFLFFVLEVEPPEIEPGKAAAIVCNVGEKPHPSQLQIVMPKDEKKEDGKEGDGDDKKKIKDEGKPKPKFNLLKSDEMRARNSILSFALKPGIHYEFANSAAFRLRIFETVEKSVCRDSTDSQGDGALFPVVTANGFNLRISFKLIYQADPTDVPYAAVLSGDLKNLKENFIKPILYSEVPDVAHGHAIEDFLSKRVKIEGDINEELKKWERFRKFFVRFQLQQIDYNEQDENTRRYIGAITEKRILPRETDVVKERQKVAVEQVKLSRIEAEADAERMEKPAAVLRENLQGLSWLGQAVAIPAISPKTEKIVDALKRVLPAEGRLEEKTHHSHTREHPRDSRDRLRSRLRRTPKEEETE